MRQAWAFLGSLFVTLSIVSTSQAQFKLDFENYSLTQHEQAQVSTFIAEIEGLLPPRVKTVIGKKVTLLFRPLSRQQQIQALPCGSETPTAPLSTTLARVQKGSRFSDLKKVKSIEVDYSILFEMINGKENARAFPCSHGSTYRLAQAAVIHEIGHLYDFMNHQSELNQQDLAYCNTLPLSIRRDDYVCKDLMNTSRSISNHPYFKHLMGWFEKGLMVQTWTNLTDYQRNPDPYELADPEEALAVNFEFFIMDPNYKCRRPVHYEYYKKQFAHEPFKNQSCEIYREVSLDSESTKAQIMGLQKLTTENLYSIDYLYADSAKAIMSRWGHAMYRLVYCKPGRPLGPDCRNDISNHLVISYRAQVDDMNINNIAGLRGDYPSKMYLMTMLDIVDDYSKNQFRDLISLPLNLNKEEMQRFIDRALEQYWTYRGLYFFLSANCATESLNLLKAARYDAKLQRLHVNTPLGLYDALVSRKIIDESLAKQNPEAIKYSYLIPGADQGLEKAFATLKAKGFSQVSSFKSAKSFLQESTPQQRESLYKTLVESPFERAEKIKLIGSGVVLENQILRNAERALLNRLSKELFDYLQGLNPKGEVNFVGTKIEEWKKIMKETKANAFSAAGYGIPFESEVSSIQDTKEELVKKRLPELNKEIINWAQRTLTTENDTVQKSTSLRSVLVKALAAIARSGD